MGKTIEIDGSAGEGGGQMLRTSLALSLLTGRPFHLRNIRARRPKPGLQAQHLMSVQAAAKIGNAKLRGASLGSGDLLFEPGAIKPGDYRFSIGTAGATSLVLHTIYLPLALTKGPSTVVIDGGTHVKASPCFHFLDRSWRPNVQTAGIAIELSMERVGFYPRGGGTIEARIKPCRRVQPFQGITTQEIRRVEIVSGSAGLPDHVAERMTNQATTRLTELGLEVSTRRESWTGGPGCMLGIELPTEPAPTFCFSIGERGKPAETVADEAVNQVDAYLRAQPLGVDEHTADQLLLPLVFAEGASVFRVANVSLHLLTNADVIAHFIDRRVDIAGVEGEPGVVTVSP